MKEKVSKKFNELYGEGAILFASPGRINLIGEHTDYNGGFVFPGAVDKGIVAAIRLNGTDKVRAYALDLGESSEFGLNRPRAGRATSSASAARFRSAAARSAVSTRCLPETCPWAPACRRRQPWSRPTHLR